jgi:signal transduction histidine kinase
MWWKFGAPHPAPTQPGADSGPRRRRALPAKREHLWLGASLLVAVATTTVLLGFGNYESRQQAAAASAGAARLAVSEINALEWQSIDESRLAPGSGGTAARLVSNIKHDLDAIGIGDAASRALTQYAVAVRSEFRLIAATKIAAARQADARRTDPAFRRLDGYLQEAAVAHTQAASRASALRALGDLAVTTAGCLVVAALLFRAAGARRALVAAEVEQRVLRETDVAKSNLISVVSHDLRTPLTAITGYLEILRDEEAGPLTEQQRRFLAVMQRSADRLLTVVGDLLFISRSEAGHIELDLEELDLGQIVAEAVEAQQPFAWQHDIELQATAVSSPPIMGDRQRIDELIENLLSNALKFTPAGGVVDAVTRPSEDCTQLDISDTGIGISEEDQKHLFELFFRSTTVTGTSGVGLGLAISKAIADAHRAAISVHSTPGKGTSFRVRFPAVAHTLAAEGDLAADAGPGRT